MTTEGAQDRRCTWGESLDLWLYIVVTVLESKQVDTENFTQQDQWQFYSYQSSYLVAWAISEVNDSVDSRRSAAYLNGVKFSEGQLT